MLRGTKIRGFSLPALVVLLLVGHLERSTAFAPPRAPGSPASFPAPFQGDKGPAKPLEALRLALEEANNGQPGGGGATTRRRQRRAGGGGAAVLTPATTATSTRRARRRQRQQQQQAAAALPLQQQLREQQQQQAEEEVVHPYWHAYQQKRHAQRVLYPWQQDFSTSVSGKDEDVASSLLQGLEWRYSEVTRVEAVSADGAVRKVRLETLPGLPSLFSEHISSRQPGQYVGLRIPVWDSEGAATKIFHVLAPIASAPERVGPRAHVDVLLDGREELVLPSAEGDNTLEEERMAWSRHLRGLAVGDILDASEEVGAGFVSLLGPRFALPALLQEHRDLLIVARGTAGMAAVASALNWHKVGLHTAHHRVTVLTEVDSAAHDPLREEQARWRATMPNVRIIPALRPRRRERSEKEEGGVEQALFKKPAGGAATTLAPVLQVDPKECAVLIAGMADKCRRARLVASLLKAGVDPSRILDHGLDLVSSGGSNKPPAERLEAGQTTASVFAACGGLLIGCELGLGA